MRRRVLAVLLTLIGGAVIALAVPFAESSARGRTDDLLLNREAEITRFAAIADRALLTGDRTELVAEITRYAEVYGAAVRVVDSSGRVVAQAGSRRRLSGNGAEDSVRRALTGRTTGSIQTIRPWGPDTVLIAEPVGRDEQLHAAVLLAAPTTAARRDVTLRWALLALAALAAFGLSALAAMGLARWVLRPVSELDRAVLRLATGGLEARAVVGLGPPELRRLEDRFNVMAEAVGEAIRRQREFVANASHELRNPLATLILRLENLEPFVAVDGGAEYNLAVEEAERLGSLLDALLALARVESAGGGPVTTVDVSAVARSRVVAWRAVADAAGIRLTDSIADGVQATAVYGAVERALDASLDNARKFVESGATVDVTVTAEEHTAVIRVADDGPGVPCEVLPRLTERFARGPEHQNVRGSGLGLAIADEIARASGGQLELSRNEPHGLIVTVTLPRASATSQP